MPFTIVRFGTLDEAKGYVVPPTKAIMFIKSDFTEFYIKSADNMGNPSLEIFKCSKVDNNTTPAVSSDFNPKEFVKISDLNEYSKNFLTRDDLKLFTDKINEIKGDLNNGKQQQGISETIS